MKFALIWVFSICYCLVALPAHAVFTISVDSQEVTDTVTNLIWRRCAEGMNWNGTTCSGTATIYTHANALLRARNEATNSGKDWRLPNVKELESLMDRSRSNPAIDLVAFPATPASYFWSSSYSAGGSDVAWGGDFYFGEIGSSAGRSYLSAVRLVRTGQ